MNICIFPILTDEVNLPVYVTNVGGWDNQDKTVRPGGLQDYSWMLCLQGKGQLILEGEKFTISKDMGFLLHPGIPHEYYPVSEPWEVRWVSFLGHGTSDILKVIGLSESGAYNLKETGSINRYINDIYITTHSHSPYKGLERSALLYSMLMGMKRVIRSNSGKLALQVEQIEPVLKFMEQNITASPSLKELAVIIDVSPQYLCFLFKKIFDLRPIEYFTRMRIQKAKELLTGNTLSIGEVAAKVGFCNHSYFCAAFRKWEGVTPREFLQLRNINWQDRKTTGKPFPVQPYPKLP